MPPPEPRITINDLTMAYGSFVIQHDLTFQHPARGNLHHYGRQRLWQEYAAAPSHRAHAARQRRRAV